MRINNGTTLIRDAEWLNKFFVVVVAVSPKVNIRSRFSKAVSRTVVYFEKIF